MPWTADTTIIGRVRVQRADADPLLTQQRVAQLMGRLELRPRGLPPAAILCVRRLHEPLPRGLDLHAAEAAAVRAWEQALVGALDQLAARAERPIHGGASATAEAVIFADRAELLACMAQDWQAGQLLGHWWWRQIVRAADLRSAVIAAWLEAPEYAPAALGHLRANAAARFLGALSEAEAQQLTRTVCARFALQSLEAVISSVPADAPRRASAPSSAGQPPSSIAPPWAAYADVAPWLPVSRQLLLGICLTLLRRPAELRSSAFASRLHQWYHARSAADASQIARSPAKGHARSLAPTPTVQQADGPAATHDLPKVGALAAGAPAVPASAASAAEAAPSAAPGSPSEMPPNIGALAAGAPAAPLSAAPAAEAGPSTALEAQPAPAQLWHDPLQATDLPAEVWQDVTEPITQAELGPITDLEITTAYGGLFYLINLALHLDLYTDFSSPEEPGLALPIWDFLALVGEQLIGSALRDDPLWPLLALLSGRSAAPPGAQFVAPEQWQVPNAWLAAFAEEEAWRWAASANRLRVWHPAGFWAIDQPLDGDPRAALAEALAPYAVAAQPGEPPQPRTAPLERWVDWLVAYAHARLMRALDSPPIELATFVLAYRARVFVSAAHVDVELDLQALPIAIRMAGLDRDPGWVPSAGRFIRFHFA